MRNLSCHLVSRGGESCFPLGSERQSQRLEARSLLRRVHRAAKGDPPAVVRRGRPRRTVLGDGEERAFSLRAANHLCKWYYECGFTLNGGSDVRILNFTAIGCHGNLQSAGHASWPLYCGARHCSCALLSGTRSCGTCSSSSSSAPIRSRSGKKSCWLVRPLMRAWPCSSPGRPARIISMIVLANESQPLNRLRLGAMTKVFNDQEIVSRNSVLGS